MVTTAEVEATILSNPVLKQVQDMYKERGEYEKLEVLERQTLKGMLKYGHAVDYMEKTPEEWEQFRLEEEVDGDVYKVAGAMREIADAMSKLSKKDQEDVMQQMANKFMGEK